MVGIIPNTNFINPIFLNEKGFIKVTGRLQLENGLRNIWAIGDCTNFPEEKMAYTAHTQAAYLLEKVFASDPLSSNIPNYSPNARTMLVSLGPASGISVINGKNVPSPGFILAKTKDNINKYAIHQITGCYPDVPFAQRKCLSCRFLGAFAV